MRRVPKAFASVLATLLLVLVGFTQGQYSTYSTGDFNAASCGLTLPSSSTAYAPPTWCSGSDIGAWVNAAILAGAATVFIGPGSFKQTTPITLPRTVRLRGAAFQTVLNWAPSSNAGWAIIVSDSGGSSVAAAHGGIEDLTVSGSGYANQTGGIYIGGSDGITGGTGAVTVSGATVTWSSGTQFNRSWSVWQPIIFGNGAICLIANVASATSLTVGPCASTPASGTYWVTGSPSTSSDPSSNYGDNVTMDRVRVFSFPVGLQWGNNSWLHSIRQSNFSANAVNIFYPSDLTVSGENEDFSDGTLISSGGFGLVLGKNGNADVDFHLYGVSVDYNTGIGLAAGNGNAQVTIDHSHFESEAQAIANYSILFVSNSFFTVGSPLTTYVVDNESSLCSIVNTSMFNAGTITSRIFNAAGTACSLFNVNWSGYGLGPVYNGNPATVLGNPQNYSNVLQASMGPACGSSAVVLGGWGTAASTSNFSGFSQSCQFTITSGTAPFAAAPTVLFTFPNGFQLPSPICTLDVHAITGSGGAIMFSNTTPGNVTTKFTATSLTGTAFTPAASETYAVVMRCGP
jgi:hypothetical protein